MIRPVHAASLAARARRVDRLVGPGLAMTLAMLVAGWTLPLMTVSTFVWLDDSVSLLDTVVALWREGEWLLFAVVALFAVAFPLAKLLAGLWLWYRVDARAPALPRALGVLDLLGRWAMLDVFVVALLVVALKASLISEVTLHAGLYVFTAAVLLSIALTQRLRAMARKAAEG
ncbi:paraquat-inducible protein A [Ferruginivarius sediminum]|uniref:Paraquat-inducible protein A n=1 Tax=Ferruginivarius sediminum TaxID=2661937 RepID=A0A369T9F5_9PROT|nr:paraquat-inducible protein A [Ferruginivarius sediminum]RDD61959.1 hypothetical protein DRB17_10770 [Ferruginivarius sediminum]